MFEWILLPEAWLALITLTALEIVLGIDNIIFISILVGRLPPAQRQRARQLGLMLAMGMRIALLLAIVWVMGLTEPLFSLIGQSFSGRDLILFGGGLFLLAKSTLEIHHSLEGTHDQTKTPKAATFSAIIVQIALIDIVFSLDSVITAVGLVDYVTVMIIAIIIAVLVMMVAAKAIGDFVDNHPTIKMLALSFLILIGFTLMGEGLGFHVPKGYVYFAMAFSLVVELLNLKIRKAREPVHLKKRLGDDS
ncbi:MULTISPECIES: TerC family protein [Pseudidiomarina]|uniref:Tellurium resistance membrane protein TerC n=3 Tax=Pseudidiomarina TaxID=2800384 RepID=A0A368UUS2_9GAMM|nr:MULTISPECIES: TerC family protein [Pseudidiomarina]MDT7525797.1 TerC family protein [Pseudidiomarina sp. GXY010]PWW13354.1 putative tellurium resistance membrane protein TerC [Pseudidiomarina maritima]RBP90821.1 putative tellurium resistance membrane protein TerC [Pseudidiomarina tainanensis]RCW32617.1 putative tellurium resistance membrane protein TerC [Pseudidiomarina tainanensis]